MWPSDGKNMGISKSDYVTKTKFLLTHVLPVINRINHLSPKLAVS